MDIQTAIAAFESDYLRRPNKKASTFNTEYGQIFRKLPPDIELTIEPLITCIESLPESSRQRKRAFTALKALATFHNLDCNEFRYIAATYSSRSVGTRTLPSDRAIVSFYQAIDNSRWQWIYGAIATYGLRPHEAFYLDVNGDGTAYVREGKTGSRKIWPYLPEWFYEFHLRNRRLPNVAIEGKTHEQLGRKCVKYLRQQARCPFQVYDLRHAWAIRVMDLGLKDNLAANQMGHTLKIHQDIYQKWISDREHNEAFKEILQNRKSSR